MITKIDWLSFTLPIGQGETVKAHRLFKSCVAEVKGLSLEVYKALFEGYDWKPHAGRAPYSMGFARADSGCYLFCHPVLPHFLIELTGQGCDALSSNQHAADVLRAIQPRLSRIDIASDMLCDTAPDAFTSTRDAGRFKSHSEFVSESGATCYIGSRSSNRYARVYRYNPPHERAHLLRSEFVLRAEDARSTAYSVLQDGLSAVTLALGKSFGWTHASWQPDDVQEAEIAVWRPERHAGKTLFWLNSAVAPAMVKLAKEGKFDAEAWLRDNVLSKLNSEQTE